MNGLGTLFIKIWICGISPRSESQNPWTRIINVNGASRLSKFWNFFGAIKMISCRARFATMGETWLYHYNPGTKQQSMQWQHSGSSRLPPKNSECKNPLGKFSPRFFGIKTASSSVIIFQRAKLSMRSITHLWWCKWRTFWRKNFFLHYIAPAHRALATQKKLAYLGFQCLDHLPYSPKPAPSHYQLFPGLKKKQL